MTDDFLPESAVDAIQRSLSRHLKHLAPERAVEEISAFSLEMAKALRVTYNQGLSDALAAGTDPAAFKRSFACWRRAHFLPRLMAFARGEAA